MKPIFRSRQDVAKLMKLRLRSLDRLVVDAELLARKIRGRTLIQADSVRRFVQRYSTRGK